MAEETEYFKQKKAQALNSITKNTNVWRPDASYVKQAQDTFDRISYQLDDGILLKQRAKREQELASKIASKCYERDDLDFVQAQQCERFVRDNDYKMKMINGFKQEFLSKTWLDYIECHKSKDLHALKTNVEKDKQFV